MGINGSAVKAFMVQDDNGEINEEASVAKFTEALRGFKSMIWWDLEKIETAANAVFDTHKGVNITDFGQFLLTRMLGMAPKGQEITPDSMSEIKGRIRDYLKENTGEFGEAKFGTKKGLNGGSFRWSDKAQNTPEVKASLERITNRKPA